MAAWCDPVASVGRTWDLARVPSTECRLLQALSEWARLGSNQRVRTNSYGVVGLLSRLFAGKSGLVRLARVLLSATRFDRSMGRGRDFA